MATPEITVPPLSPKELTEQEEGLKEMLFSGLFTWAARLGRALALTPAAAPPARPSPVERTIQALQDELGRIALWNDPKGLYAHCLCGEEQATSAP